MNDRKMAWSEYSISQERGEGDEFANAFILTGPTASGKSELALDLAERIHAEIVCMDSMTLYKRMDIGTAKPTPEERRRVPHHLVDIFEPWESASVAWWLAEAASTCNDLAKKGKRALIVGGTPFYLKAMLQGLFPAPPADESIRQKFELQAQEHGKAFLHQKLATVDPLSANRLHPNDVRRVVRALEVYTLTGRPISEFQQTWTSATFAGKEAIATRSIPGVVLAIPRDELYLRINQRVQRMMDSGWLDEARQLQALPQPLGREASQALGYSELFEYLSHPLPSLSSTIECIQTRTRQFAKRQLTWFRNLSGFTAIQALDDDRIGKIRAIWEI